MKTKSGPAIIKQHNVEELGKETGKELLGREYAIENILQEIRNTCADNLPDSVKHEFSEEGQEKAIQKCTETFIDGLHKVMKK